MGLLGELRSAAADLLAGSECVGCAHPGRPLCQSCGRRLRDPPFRAEPSPRPSRLPAVWAAAPYDGVVRAALLAHKERAMLALTPMLGRLLSRSVVWCLAAAEAAGHDPERALLVPVPSRTSVVRARGHDPVLRMSRLAAGAARAAGLDVAVAPVLRLGRYVRDQSSLDREQRRANLSGAMRSVAAVHASRGWWSSSTTSSRQVRRPTSVPAFSATQVCGLAEWQSSRPRRDGRLTAE